MPLNLVDPRIKRLIEASGAAIKDMKKAAEYDDHKQITSVFDVAYYSNKHDYIAINKDHPIVRERINEIALHELGHWTGASTRLARAVSVELNKGAHGLPFSECVAFDPIFRNTEELTAQLCMHKVGTYLGLDKAYLDSALEQYIRRLFIVNDAQAHRESDEAAAYLINLLAKAEAA